MGTGTLGKQFQTGGAVLQGGAIERSCHTSSDLILRIDAESSFHHILHGLFPGILLLVPGKKLLPEQRRLTFQNFLKSPCQIRKRAFGIFHFPDSILGRPLQNKRRKQLPDCTDQKGLGHGFPSVVGSAVGEIQFIGWLCHIQVQIEPLSVQILPVGGRQGNRGSL